MFRVFIKIGDAEIEGGQPQHVQGPVEACAVYWRLVKERRDGPSALVIRPPAGLEELEARFRLDAAWSAGPREMARDRWLTCWATPAEGWHPPSPTELRGLLEASGLSQMAAGRMLGISGRTVRNWCSGKTAPSYAEWFTIRESFIRA